jgi:hypothetical protein
MDHMTDSTVSGLRDDQRLQMTPLSPPCWGTLRTQVEDAQQPLYSVVLIVGWVPSAGGEFAPVILHRGSTRAQVAPLDNAGRLFIYPTLEEAAAARP